MKTGIYWQDPKYAVGRRHRNPSCVLYLPLHRLDGASFMSKDARGHLCIVTGALWRPDGRLFDGVDDSISYPSALNLGNENEYTIEAWFKTPDPVTLRTVLSQGNSGNNTPRLVVVSSSSTISLWHKDDAGTQAGVGSGASTINSNTWYHVVVVRRAVNDWELFLDGVSKDTDSTSVGTTTLNTFNLGRHQNTGWAWPFDGTIGEVGIYNRALTPLEIQHRYLATKRRYR